MQHIDRQYYIDQVKQYKGLTDATSKTKYNKAIQILCNISFEWFVNVVAPEAFGITSWYDFQNYIIHDIDINLPNQKLRYILNMPQQHGKSVIIFMLMAWMLGAYPNQQAMYLTYNEDRAVDGANGVKNVMKTKVYQQIFPNVRLKQTLDMDKVNTNGKIIKENATRFDIVDSRGKPYNGKFYSMSFFQDIPGKSVHNIVVDDYHSSMVQADSVINRNKIWDIYSSTVIGRSQIGGSRIMIVSTRYHDDDIVGRIMREQWAIPYLLRVFPAIQTDTDRSYDPRPVGTPLMDVRQDLYQDMQKDLTKWWCIWQQMPMNTAGKKIDVNKIKYWDTLPVFNTSILSIDASGNGKTTNDDCAIGYLGKTSTDYYLGDFISTKMNYATTKQAVRDFVEKYPDIQYIVIEEKVLGIALVEEMREEFPSKIVVGVIPSTNKMNRLNEVSDLFEDGLVHFEDPAQNFTVYSVLDQIKKFTGSSKDKDDLIDIISQGLKFLRDNEFEANINMDDLNFTKAYRDIVQVA